MIKKLLLVGTLALLASFNAEARIGYTLDECVKQYGSNYKSYDFGKSGTSYTWETNYFKIAVSFAPGVSTAGLITYDAKDSGQDTVILTNDPEKDYKQFFAFFTPQLIKDLLEKNVPGANWKKSKAEGLETDYAGTKDGAKIAEAQCFYHLIEKGKYDRCGEYDHPQLSVETVAYKQFEDARAKEDEAEVNETPKKSASSDL